MYLVKRELVNFCLVRVSVLSVRRDNVLAGQANCVLGEHIFDLSSSRISQPTKRAGRLAKQMHLIERIYFAKRVISCFNLLFFGLKLSWIQH